MIGRLTFLAAIIHVYLVSVNGGSSGEINEDYLTFPPNFLIGAGTSAYQIEGGWNASDKGESIWDRFAHDGKVANNDTGDVACRSYEKYKEDVAILKDLGFDVYRFSVSWSRILPTGFTNKISKDGVNYYKKLIDELLANNIQPMLTLYHWDHPQALEDLGGWTNEKMIDWYAEYARVVFAEFGDKVKFFFTINEPACYCIMAYNENWLAPDKTLSPEISQYLCVHNMMKAHAKAYHLYQEEFKSKQNGEIGIIKHVFSYYPHDPTHSEAVERAYQFFIGWILHPIYSKTGDYPNLMKDRVANLSRAEGYSWSRLPEFSPDWIEYIKGTADFLGINHYTSNVIENTELTNQTFLRDAGVKRILDSWFPNTTSNWLQIAPKGFGDILRKIAKDYNNPKMYITENGFPNLGGTEDYDRIKYFHDYLKEMLTATKRDGVNLRGYVLWSFFDNFEWGDGYSNAFGIVQVDFKDPERKRTLKKSALWWREVARSKKILPVPEIVTAAGTKV